MILHRTTQYMNNCQRFTVVTVETSPLLMITLSDIRKHINGEDQRSDLNIVSQNKTLGKMMKKESRKYQHNCFRPNREFLVPLIISIVCSKLNDIFQGLAYS